MQAGQQKQRGMPRLLKLTLSNFRNYERLVWSPDASLLVLTGENGSGKTNLLEAVSLLSPGRGLRAAPLTQFGRMGATNWGISARIETEDEFLELGTGTQGGQERPRRVFLLNGRQIRGQEAWEDTLATVWITPQMDRLFSEGASGRRRFLDRLVMAVTPHHARELAAYDRAMTQRNKLLQTRFSEHSWLSGLEASMARHAVAVAAARQETVRQICHYAQNGLGAFPAAIATLECTVAQKLETSPALAVEDWLREKLADLREDDAARGRATFGTHRSDFLLEDLTSRQPAALASTGQQKSLLIGVVLAHARLVTDYRGQPPILLLDEPLVHLDAARRASLLEIVQDFRTTVLLTGTDQAPFAPLKQTAQFETLKNGAFLLSGS